MSEQQPEPLRLAELLEASGILEPADELRRLHTLNQELLDALQVMLDAAQHDITQECDIARAAIAKAIG